MDDGVHNSFFISSIQEKLFNRNPLLDLDDLPRQRQMGRVSKLISSAKSTWQRTLIMRNFFHGVRSLAM